MLTAGHHLSRTSSTNYGIGFVTSRDCSCDHAGIRFTGSANILQHTCLEYSLSVWARSYVMHDLPNCNSSLHLLNQVAASRGLTHKKIV